MLRSLFLASVLLISVTCLLPVAFAEIQEEVSVDILEIWVKATDKDNRIVPDLNPEEFRVFIDGKETDLRCFDRVFEDPFDFASMEEPSEPANKRRFIFFFDLLNTPARSMDYMKSHVADFMYNSFREGDEGMVFVLTPTVHLGVVQAMTSNKETLIDTIHKIRGNPTLEARVRNNERQVLDLLYSRSAIGGGAGGGGLSLGLTNRSEETIREARAYVKTLAAEEENLSQMTLNSFLSIAQYLSGNSYDGRLVMIYASGGFSLRPGQNYYEMIDRAIEEQTVVGSEDLVFHETPDRDFEREVVKTIGVLNRLNVTIYSVDARGLTVNDRGVERNTQQLALGFNTLAYGRELQDSLSIIANETGGLAFVNTQNYQRGLAEIASDMNQQYWLCASVPYSKKRGGYHKVEVKVDRPGVKLRHRKGYID